MRSHSHDGVDMSVGIITHQITMVEPYHIPYMEEIPELAVDVLAGERLVAVRRQQALRCGEERTLAVALYASAFEHEALVVFQRRIEGSLIVELQIDGIVLFPVEFLAPSVELEVEQMDRDDVRIVSAWTSATSKTLVVNRWSQEVPKVFFVTSKVIKSSFLIHIIVIFVK